MDEQKAARTLERIEEQAEVTGLTCAGLRVWPLIRTSLWRQMLDPGRNDIHKSTPGRKHPALMVRQEGLTSLRSYQGSELVFFSSPDQHTERIGGRWFAPCLDPILAGTRDRRRVLKIEPDTPEKRDTLPRYEPTFFVESPLLGYREPTGPPDETDRIAGWADLASVVADAADGMRPDEGLFVEQVRIVEQYKLFFHGLLSEVEPRAVFLSRGDHLIGMGLIWACKEIGAVCVDVRQGAAPGAFIPWTRIPVDGYELLPDLFWTWDAAEYELMERFRAPEVEQYRGLFVGPAVRSDESTPPTLDKDRAEAAMTVILERFRPTNPDAEAVTGAPSPESPDDYRLMCLAQEGAMLLQNERPEEALSSLDQALAFGVPLLGLHYARAVALHRLARNEEAAAAAAEELALTPQHVDAQRLIASLAKSDWTPTVVPSVIEMAPAEIDPSESLLRGEKIFGQGRLDEAEQIFIEVLDQRPDHPAAMNDLACVYWRTGRVEQAAETLERANEIAPGNREVVWNLGQVLQFLERGDETVILYRGFIDQHPEEQAMRQAMAEIARSSDSISDFDPAAGTHARFGA
ncbi:MAG: tetratricopeptide repeat protein [Proteobacteria bacterium]|nr:tetratricopeptide repeat protein [Pseudomonadota bacterium]